MEGYIYTICPACYTKLRVLAHFKNYYSKFDDMVITCECCNSELKVTDNNNLPDDE